MVVDAKSIIPTPDNMTDEVACQAFVNPFTAYAMLEEANLKEGDTILYGKYAGTEISYEGRDYLIMRESDIFAII